MGYTVKDLLKSNRFPEMHLISGSAGIDREIKKPRFIEVEDMEKFLVGGGSSYDQHESIQRCR